VANPIEGQNWICHLSLAATPWFMTMKTRIKAIGLLCALFLIDCFFVICLYSHVSKSSFLIIWPSVVKLIAVLRFNRVEADLRFKTWQEGVKFITEFFGLYVLSGCWLYIRSGTFDVASDVQVYLIGYVTRYFLVEWVFQSEISRLDTLAENERQFQRAQR